MTEALVLIAALGCPAAMGAMMWVLLRSWRRSAGDDGPDTPDKGESGEDQ